MDSGEIDSINQLTSRFENISKEYEACKTKRIILEELLLEKIKNDVNSEFEINPEVITRKRNEFKTNAKEKNNKIIEIKREIDKASRDHKHMTEELFSLDAQQNDVRFIID